jgi:hypothetical protein
MSKPAESLNIESTLLELLPPAAAAFAVDEELLSSEAVFEAGELAALFWR